MTDELETRLQAAFRSGTLPAAPASLVNALEAAAEGPVARVSRTHRLRSSSRGPLRMLGVAAILLIGGTVAWSIGNRGPSPLPVPSALPSPVSSQIAEPTAADMVEVIYAPQWTAAVPASRENLGATLAIVQKRLDATGVVGIRATSDSQGRIVVEIPADANPDPIRRLIGQVGHIGFVPLEGEPAKVGSHIDFATSPDLLEGIVVPDATVVDDELGNPSLQLSLGEPGTRLFADYTAAHVGSPFAIALDGTVVASPIINQAIPDGEVLITFNSASAPDAAELARIATIVQSGPLPVPLIEVANGAAPSAS